MKNHNTLVIIQIAIAALLTIDCFAQSDYHPLKYSPDSWYGSTFWTGSGWTRVGKNWQHPGDDTPSVRKFVCPADGKITVSGRVFKMHQQGDGIRAAIIHNEKELWRKEIEGVDGKGVEHALQLDAKKGDTLRFVVHKRIGIACDTTGWDPLVAYVDGKSYQASEAFNAKKQGEAGWFYEQAGVSSTPSVAQVAPLPAVPVNSEFIKKVVALGANFSSETEGDLLALVAEEWWREDCIGSDDDTYRIAAKKHLEQSREIAEARGVALPALFKPLVDKGSPQDSAALLNYYLSIRLLKRELLLSDPQLKFGELLVCKRRTTAYAHLVGQYYGWYQRSGGGLCALKNPGFSLATRDLISNRLPEGSILEPRLSYDGKRVLFAFVACGKEPPDPNSLSVNEQGSEELYFHLYELDLNQSGEKGLRQLTLGHYDDLMAEYLPGGGIVFCSTRRKGYSRCFGPRFSKRWDNYTLHRSDNNGDNIRTLSYNDVSEWFPAISNSGELLFARWDYIDRDAVTHQNLWSMRPDGTNPMAVWGNALPAPHCTFQAKPIPGSHKLVFIASAHHSITAGPVCLLNTAAGLNNPEAVERITPIHYPEAEGWKIPEWYESPWPLSENLFLASYSPNQLRNEGQHLRGDRNSDKGQRIVLLDRLGNRELIYRDTEINTTTPIPLRSRPSPPVLASLLPENPPPSGEFNVYDIYTGLPGVNRGEIVAIRVVQLFPKTTPIVNSPRIGVAGEENTRAILGTVPVEADGSARFIVPAQTKIFFQALDKDGFARRTMRSATYLQPGEATSCVGCHNYDTTAAMRKGLPLAMKRPPSKLDPGNFGGRPFGFVEMVQPVFDAKCIACHNDKEAQGGINLTRAITGGHGYTASYQTLCFGESGGRRVSKKSGKPLIGCYPSRNRIHITPVNSEHSAYGSQLVKMLKEGHSKVTLTDEQLRRIITWIDMNSIFYGVYEPADQLAMQREGKPVPMPEIQ